MADQLAPLTTPGCIVEVEDVSPAFGCSAEPTHAGLVLINDQVFLAFSCLEHKARLITPRCARRIRRQPRHPLPQPRRAEDEQTTR